MSLRRTNSRHEKNPCLRSNQITVKRATQRDQGKQQDGFENRKPTDRRTDKWADRQTVKRATQRDQGKQQDRFENRRVERGKVDRQLERQTDC